MGKFKGTQGKWKHVEMFKNHLITDDKGNILDIRDNESNAKLIATAPEMLVLLEEFIQWSNDSVGLIGDITQRAELLIKKATE